MFGQRVPDERISEDEPEEEGEVETCNLQLAFHKMTQVRLCRMGWKTKQTNCNHASEPQPRSEINC